MVVANKDGAVELYHNNEKVLATDGSKVNVKQRIQIHNDAPASGHGMAIGQWDGSNHRIEGDANRPMVITSYNSGGIKMGVSGANKVAVTSDGLTFNGDTAAANALDDYEEGSWTPNDASGGGVTINSTGTGGTYTKIGRLVHVQYNITYGSTSNNYSAAIGGLPFSLDVQYGTGVVGWTSRDNPAGIMGLFGSSSQIYFMDNTSASSNSGKHLQNQELSGVQIIGNATYYAAT